VVYINVENGPSAISGCRELEEVVTFTSQGEIGGDRGDGPG
jgi:hypothetical protein